MANFGSGSGVHNVNKLFPVSGDNIKKSNFGELYGNAGHLFSSRERLQEIWLVIDCLYMFWVSSSHSRVR